MSNEAIVQQESPAISTINPFARGLASHVNAGTVAIESERAIAEAQGKLVIAKRFPRNEARAYDNIIEACRRQGLAEEACYSFPRANQVVSGPTIRMAEMLAANWGNVDYGIRELSRKDGVSEMEAYCWDLETNTMSSQKFTVRHIRDTRSGPVKLTDERDIYELTANLGARRLRARVLAILPADLIQAAVDECTRTLAGNNSVPMADRIRNMIAAFKSLGVPATLLEKRLGHSLDSVTGDELADLRKIHNSLRDGMSKLGDWFNDGTQPNEDIPYSENEQAPATLPQEQKRATPPPRQKRGAAAVLENRPTTTVAEARAQESVTPIAEASDATSVSPAAAAAKIAEKPTPQPEQPKPAPAEQPKPAEPSDDAAKAHAAAQALKADEPPAPPAAKAPEVAPRAFLKDTEELTVDVTVSDVVTLVVNPKAAATPSVQAHVKGGFNGMVIHVGGAEKHGDKLVPNPLWVVGKTVTLKMLGKLNKITGRVLPMVQSITEAPSETSMEVE